ncbi:MAG: polysaccharide biosynthesis C-terminal domain-containing protein [Ignavibacteria bacterium]|nr:polysaccharide biosynthesis C-terminal domain-containing protein [Ignavibacteria bacterium]
MNNKITSTLAGAFIFITILNLFSRGLGFLREVLFANYFGRGIDFDVYLIGAVIPITINTVALFIGQNYFIPAYYKTKLQNPDSTDKFFTANFFVFILIGFIISIALYFLSESIIDVYLNTDNNSLKEIAVNIFRLFLITIPFTFAISILTAFEQAEYKFKYPAIGRLFLNFTIIPILIFFTDKFGIYTIPLGFILGIFFQFIYLLIKGKSRVSFSFFSLKDKREVFNFLDITIFSIILIETIGQFYLLADRYFFKLVDQGGIASLSYASNLFNLPVSVVSLAFATVIFPKFSENIQTNSFDKLQKNLSDSISANLLFFVPIAFLLFFYGDSIIKLLFERGKFNESDTLETFLVLKTYAFSLIFYSTYVIFNKIIYAAKFVNSLLLITVTGIVLKIILNFIFVGLWKQNGLALATSVSYLFFFLSGFILVYKKLPMKNQSLFFNELVFHLTNGIFSYFIIQLMFYYIIQNYNYINLMKIFFFLSVYILNVYLIGNKSLVLVKELLNSIRSVKSI